MKPASQQSEEPNPKTSLSVLAKNGHTRPTPPSRNTPKVFQLDEDEDDLSKS
jgi:hypothetical protein